jgi:hypothetical protein
VRVAASERGRGASFKAGKSSTDCFAILGAGPPSGHLLETTDCGARARRLQRNLWAGKSLRPSSCCELIQSDKIDNALVELFLKHCADPTWWTQITAFTEVHG